MHISALLLICLVLCRKTSSDKSSTIKRKADTASRRDIHSRNIPREKNESKKKIVFQIPPSLKNTSVTGCQKFTYISTLKRKGCLPKLITQVVCWGLCNSVTLPFYGVCEVCRPTGAVEKEAELDCPRDQHIQKKKVKYYLIQNCTCGRVKC